MNNEARDIILLEEIVGMIGVIDDYGKGLSENEFYKSDITKDATLLRLIMIGELVNKLSEEIRTSESHVQWNQIKAARNFYVHQYGYVDWTSVWEVKNKHLAILKQQIQIILENK